MNAGYHVVGVFLCVSYHIKIVSLIICAENSGGIFAGFGRVDGFLGARCSNVSDLYSIYRENNRSFGFGHVTTGANVWDADRVESSEGIEKGVFAVIIDVIICHENNVSAKLLDDGYAGRIGAEGVGFAGELCAAGAVRVFIVEHEETAAVRERDDVG